KLHGFTHKSLSDSIPSLRSNQQPALSLPVKKRSHEPPPLPVLMIPKRVQRTQSSKSFQVKKNYQHHHYHNPAQLRAQQKRTIVVLNTVIVIPIMGNKLDKIEPGTGRKICPEEFGVENKIGLAYCVLHHAPSDITSDEVEKYSHHGLAIDINGLSNDEMFRAAHFDLYVRGPTDYSTYVEYNYKERKWTDYALVQPIGRIPSSVIQQYGQLKKNTGTFGFSWQIRYTKLYPNRLELHYEKGDKDPEMAENEVTNYRVYRIRWIQLLIYVLPILANATHSMTFVPIESQTSIFFGITITQVNALAIVFQFLYAIDIILSIWVYRFLSMRVEMIVGSILNLGVFIRLLSLISPTSGYPALIIGLILPAIAQSVFLNITALFAAQ
ncbi:unnamed protein product, partial [Rotaria sp. Silwood1]